MQSNPLGRWMFLGLIAAALAAGCGGSAPDAPPPEPGTPAEPGAPAEPAKGDWLIQRLPAEPPHLNPYTSSDAYASTILLQVFDGLLDRDPETLQMNPHVAESFEISEDFLEYTFRLREDVVFSDGTPLTAQDVQFSYETMMDPAVDSPHLKSYFGDIIACEVLDDHTVRFRCSQPYYRHLVMIGGMDIIPRHIYGEGDFNTHPNNRRPIGSGPYMVSEWTTGQQLTLVRNPNYWGEAVGKTPYFDRRVYKIITDPVVALQVMQRGELDADTLLPEDWVDPRSGASTRFEERFNKFEYAAPRYSYIGWNSQRPQFADKRVRRALTMLVNRDLIRDTIYHGYAQVVSGNFMPGTAEHHPEIQPWPYDPEGAVALLDEAGWTDTDRDGIRDKDGTAFRFELLISNQNPIAEKIATVLQEELRRIGISMRIRQLEWASMLERVNSREFDAMMMGWSMPPDPDPYQVWHSSQAETGSNYIGFKHEEADRLIEQARVEFDDAARALMYNRFHEIVHEEQPYTFLFTPKTLLAVDRRVHGITMYPYGPDALEWYVPQDLHRYGR